MTLKWARLGLGNPEAPVWAGGRFPGSKLREELSVKDIGLLKLHLHKDPNNIRH